MLRLLLGEDWVANQNVIMQMIANDVKAEKTGRVLIVPELISHNVERRLCEMAGDTASRFAEVSSFTRLAKTVADQLGLPLGDCLDDGGRLVTMAAAVQFVNSKLKAYASVGTKPEFLVGLVDAVDEFKRCCIAPTDLMQASKNTEGSLAQKLEELSLIYESYNSICAQGKKDPRDVMQWLLEELESCSFAEDHVFYIDGFPDFTRQNMAIIEHLLCNAPQVTMSFCCDEIGSSGLAFEKAAETVEQLVKLAKKHDVDVEIRSVPKRDTAIMKVCASMFQGPIESEKCGLTLFKAESVYHECVHVANRINELIQTGVRYREIGVVCTNPGTYRNTICNVFQRSHIPGYVSGTDNILEMPVIKTILAAIDTAMGGFEQADVIRFLKTPFAPIDEETCDLVEEYIYRWNITGMHLTKTWTKHPSKLAGEMTEQAVKMLERLNRARDKAIMPLVKLHDGMTAAKNIAQQVEAVCTFFDDISLAEKMSKMADQLETEDNRTAQVLNQIWDILLSALEQLHDAVGSCAWDAGVFSRLFKLLLSQYSVGTIPAAVDSVTVGPVASMRCQEVKHLFVLGATEGNFPAFGGVSGVLTDMERDQLRVLGLPLTGGAMDGLQIEFSEIYGAFCGASDSVTVSYSVAQPSFVYERLLKIAGREETVDSQRNGCWSNRTETAAYFVRHNRADLAEQMGLKDEFDAILQKNSHTLGELDKESVKGLYGEELRLSATKVDSYASCRFAYFLQQGMRLKDREEITLDSSMMGTYFHYVLEYTVKDVMNRGGFATVSVEDTLEIAKNHAAAYTKKHFAELDSERVSYLLNRNFEELMEVVAELWTELSQSEFLPKFTELHFEDGAEMPQIDIDNAKMSAYLTGYVDRVDVWNRGDDTYFRVVDYKSGKKSFDYCDVLVGIGLQMLLYLYALLDNGQHLIAPDAIPAGVQYFPARMPVVSVDGPDALKKKTDALKRKGIILADEGVVQAMEPGDKPVRLSYSRSKEGSLTGDVASQGDFLHLKEYVFKLLRGFVNEIADGKIEPNPYCRDRENSACKYCPFINVCHVDDVENIRKFKAVKADEFWETVRKED